MATSTLVTIEEYLSASYPDGDREYLDGQVLERNMGESGHARIQSWILGYLLAHYPQYWSVVECRMKVGESRYRIPDVCLGADAYPESGPLLDPPFLAVEVLSPDDRASDLEEKIADYLGCGVRYVWVVNPQTKRAFVHTSEASREAKDGMLRTLSPSIELPLSAIFPPRPVQS